MNLTFLTRFAIVLVFVHMSIFSIAQSNIVLVDDVYPGLEGGGMIDPVVINDKLVFFAQNSSSGIELFACDQFYQVEIVKDINPGGSSSLFLDESLRVKGVVMDDLSEEIYYFLADDGAAGMELWRSNGTPGGTSMVKDIYPGAESGALFGANRDLIVMGSHIYFEGATENSNGGLWKSDGTAGGTVMVKDSLLFISYPTVLNNILYFSAYHQGTQKTDLWRTDGTEDGTYALGSDNNVCCGLQPEYVTAFNGMILFSGVGETSGRELWKSNGTDAGTTLLMDINSGPASSNPRKITDASALGGLADAVFVADNGVVGEELWKTDGTAPNTVLIEDIHPGPAGSDIDLNAHTDHFTILYEHLYFSANDGVQGQELWLSDGYSTGTYLEEDFIEGIGSGAPANFYIADGYVYFSAETADWGRELFRLGVPIGYSEQVEDVREGESGSYPASFAMYDGRLFFVADDYYNGPEIHVLMPESNPYWDVLQTNILETLQSMYCVESVCFAVGNEGVVMKSTDGGDTWSVLNSGVTSDLRDVYFTSVMHGFAVGADGTCIVTLDGGNTWSVVDLSVSNTLRSIQFVNEDSGWIVGNNGVVFHTSNGGLTWTQQVSGVSETITSVYFVNENLGWACGFNGLILHTINGGVSWNTQVSNTSNNLFAISFATEFTGMCVGANGTILRTIDGGSNWFAVESNTSYPLYAALFIDEENAYTAGGGGTILKSTSGGSSWEAEEYITSQGLKGMARSSEEIFICGESGKVLRSYDGSVSIADMLSQETFPELYPNPVHNGGFVSLKNTEHLPMQMIEIYSVQGQLISRTDLSKSNRVYIGSDIAPGIYMYRLVNGEQASTTGKLIVE